MTVAKDKFRIYAEEFAFKSDAQVEAMVTDVGLRIDVAAFGARADQAIAHLAAHEFALIERRKSAPLGLESVGAVNSVGAENVSLGFQSDMPAADSHEDSYYRQTSHGLAFLQIRDSRAEVGMGILT